MSIIQDTKDDILEENEKAVQEAVSFLDSASGKRKVKDNSKRSRMLAGRFKLFQLLYGSKNKK